MISIRFAALSAILLILSPGPSNRPPSLREAPGGVEVTPDGDAPALVNSANSTGLVAGFFVKNTRTVPSTYTLSCLGSENVICDDVEPNSVSLDPNESTDIAVYYSTGPPGEGTLTARASGPVSDRGYYDVTVTAPPTVTLIVPRVTSGNRAVVANRTPMVRAMISKGSYSLDTTKTRLIWRGDTVTKWAGDSLTVARFNRGLRRWPRSLRHLESSRLISASHCSRARTVARTRRPPLRGFGRHDSIQWRPRLGHQVNSESPPILGRRSCAAWNNGGELAIWIE